MGEDEVATVRTLTAYREVMAALIRERRGRVVDATGDNLLAEFASVVDAMECAVELQREFKSRNAELPAPRRLLFRIGINLGDVIVEGERIYGDGVNIAARVEGLAEPGGIAISGTVYDQVKNKLALAYEPLGEHVVKNIREPVRVYRVLPELEPAGTRPEIGKAVGRRRWRRAMLLLGVVLLAVAGGVAVWSLAFRSRSDLRSRTSSRSRTSLSASTSSRTSGSPSGSIGSCPSWSPLARVLKSGRPLGGAGGDERCCCWESCCWPSREASRSGASPSVRVPISGQEQARARVRASRRARRQEHPGARPGLSGPARAGARWHAS